MADDDHTTEQDVAEASPEASQPAGPTESAVARGRASGTPFVLLGGVAFTIWTVVAIVTAAVLLIWWLG
jgi:hypothetical protein